MGLEEYLTVTRQRRDLHSEFKQIFKAFVPSKIIWLLFELNTIELSNMLRCHGTWFSFLIQLIAASLFLNPLPERGVGSVLLWHEAVTELYLEFA